MHHLDNVWVQKRFAAHENNGAEVTLDAFDCCETLKVICVALEVEDALPCQGREM